MNAREKAWIEKTVANDKSGKGFLHGRFFVFFVLIVLQIVLYVAIAYAFAYDSAVGVAVQIAIGVLSLAIVLYLLGKTDKPSTKLAWILLILLVPVVGVPTYFLYGDGRPTKKMHKKIVAERERNANAFENTYGKPSLFVAQNRAEGVGAFLEKAAGYPVCRDGEVVYYSDGAKLFAAIKEALQGAKSFILLEYFIIKHGKMWNEILSLLLEKARAGVRIRILYDDFGCMMSLPARYDAYLESLHENIRCMAFNPVVPVLALRMNNRDHRKILVVDGERAFTGGVNLADEYIGAEERFGYWKDTGVQVQGSAVDSFTQMFFTLWNAFYREPEDVATYFPPRSSREGAEKKEWRKDGFLVQPYDDSPLDKISVGAGAYADFVSAAEKYVWIFTPYLVLDDYLRGALCQAALRGVDVRIVVPGIPDKKTVYRLTRANYGTLLQAGVKIYEYAPGFIHAKSMLCDDKYAIVGTVNLDYRSLYHHFENAVYFAGCDAVLELKRDCEETFAVSRLCDETTVKRSFFGKVWDCILRIFETLL